MTQATSIPMDGPAESPKHGHMHKMTRKFLLATIGMAVLVQDELEAFIQRMVDRGELAAEDARQLVKEVVEKREKMELEKKAREQRSQQPGATRADVEALNARIVELTRKIEELSQKPPHATD